MRIAICFNSRQYQPIFFSLSRTRYSTRSQTSPKFWRMCTIYNYDSNKKKYMKGTATSIWIIEHKRVRESEKKSCVWCFNLKPPGKRNATAIRKKGRNIHEMESAAMWQIIKECFIFICYLSRIMCWIWAREAWENVVMPHSIWLFKDTLGIIFKSFFLSVFLFIHKKIPWRFISILN